MGFVMTPPSFSVGRSSHGLNHEFSSLIPRQAYIPPEEDGGGAVTRTKEKKSLHPKIGDLVRYYDLDGGDRLGQQLVGKITFLTKTSSGFLAELTELEDVGDGFYAEYGSQKRMSKKTDRDLSLVSPIMASYVRSEQAFRVPLAPDGQIQTRQETYDLDDYEGPVYKVDTDVVKQDGINYGTLKFNLLKNAAITGLAGSFVVNIIKGTEDAVIYFMGALASVGYLFFLSVKTDTMASEDAKLGSNVSNLRFLMPVFVILGVALYNQSQGDLNPVKDTGNPFDTVTTEQFAVAVLGFLTYRVPLFIGQVRDAFKEDMVTEDAMMIPGSAGMALKLVTKEDAANKGTLGATGQPLVPVLLVSGPQFTGRSRLVQELLEQDDRLVVPKLLDRMQDGVTFERLEDRNEFLQMDPTGRFGLTKDSILQAASNENKDDGDNEECTKVVVVDADVGLVKQLQAISGIRLIGVWVGLNTVGEFEERLEKEMKAGNIEIPAEESKESVMRTKIREIVSEIEYGLGSGIFEFTILNEDGKRSLKELKEAAEYCFK